MDVLISLAVVTTILLVPLVPSAVLYKALSPKNVRRPQGLDQARGQAGAGDVRIAGFRIQFNVVGSSAIYIVLVAASYLMYERISSKRFVESALSSTSAWLVEVPVKLKGNDNKEIRASNGELQQARVELEPALTRASATTLQFWVVPNNGRFPTARFSHPSSVSQQILDLNDENRVSRNFDRRQMKGIAPVWIEFGQGVYVAQSVPNGRAGPSSHRELSIEVDPGSSSSPDLDGYASKSSYGAVPSDDSGTGVRSSGPRQ